MSAETKTVSKFAKAKKIFGAVFIVSGLVSVSLLIFSFLSMSSTSSFSSSSISPDEDTASNSNRSQTTASNTVAQPSEAPKLSKTPTPTVGSNSAAANKASGSSKSSNDNTQIAQVQRQSTPPPLGPSYSTTATPAAFNTPQQRSSQTRSLSPAATFFAATLVLSIFLTIVSLLGFLIVATVAWRRERQAKESLNIAAHRQAIEVERLKYELEKSRQQATAAAAANTSQVMLCPVCKKTYADGSLRFCVDDGATLSFYFNSNSAETDPNFFNKTLVIDDNSSAETLDARKIIDKYK